MAEKTVYIDTETTGIDAKKHGITQIAGEIWVDHKMVDDFDFKFRPFDSCKIDKEALNVTGVTIKDLVSRSMGPNDAYNNFKSLLGEYVDPFNSKDKFHFTAYNAKFDWDFMQEFFRHNDDKYFGSFFWFPPRDVCTLLSYFLGDSREHLSNFKLATIAKHLDIKAPGDYHDAMVDIYITREIERLILSSLEWK
jgi:DNA polymerase-3 subunit epsilon